MIPGRTIDDLLEDIGPGAELIYTGRKGRRWMAKKGKLITEHDDAVEALRMLLAERMRLRP